MVYNQFFEFNDNYKLESNLIESYSQISDKSYVFKLKDNIVFSNGKVLTSKDKKYDRKNFCKLWFILYGVFR